MTIDESRLVLARLSRLPGLHAEALLALVDQFGSLEQAVGASASQLARVLGTHPDLPTAIANAQDFESDRDWLGQPDNHLISVLDEIYPGLLREIPDPPAFLYVRGDPALLSFPQLAVVGSRNPTPVGRETALAFARSLAGAGLTITSGLALGIDGAAHEGALDAGGQTVAVAGTGLDRVYPPAHHSLAHRIAEHGALVSEFPLGTPPKRENFPRRNRIIAGLSLGTLVVEAAVRSGSLITARLAGEQGREVFAIPGSIHSPLSRGCHALIRQGAKLVETADDILAELGPMVGGLRAAVSAQVDKPVDTTEDERRFLDQLGADPVDVDTVVERTGLTPEAISSMLLDMELRGLVESCADGRYQRTKW
ncbi:MAG: DNA-processing protein DprA [Acidiferrobacteraceae bacterium]|jgi:DNA processing protein